MGWSSRRSGGLSVLNCLKIWGIQIPALHLPSTGRDTWPWTQCSVPRAQGRLSPTQPGLFYLISVSNHVLGAFPEGLCFYSQKEREKCHLTCGQVVTPAPGDLRTPFSRAPGAAGAIYEWAENGHSSWLEWLAPARHLLEPLRQWDQTQ